MATLFRRPIKFPVPHEATLALGVARDSAQYLGYNFAERRNAEVHAALTRREILIKTQNILKSCGIIPLDNKAVLRYQKNRRDYMNRSHPNSTWRWRMTEITDYKAEIPEFALVRATKVARLLTRSLARKQKDATPKFHISELVGRKISHPDPFMVLTIIGHDFYLDVWDEPNFKAKKKA